MVFVNKFQILKLLLHDSLIIISTFVGCLKLKEFIDSY